MRAPRKAFFFLAVSASIAVAGALYLAFLCIYNEETRTRYLLWKNFENLGRNEQGFAEYRHKETGITFILLPGGSYLMGDAKGGPRFPAPEHEVSTTGRAGGLRKAPKRGPCCQLWLKSNSV